MKNIKLCVTYKNRHKMLDSDMIIPIQTGRDISDEIFDDILGDNTGDNVSFLNSKLAEFTAIYWCWKHYDEIGNPDYIGFMHYRRHFLFSLKEYDTTFFGLEKFSNIDDDYVSKHLKLDNIQNILEQYDLIIPKEVDVSKTEKIKSNYEHYKKAHHIADYEKAMEILSKKSPEIVEAAEEYNNSNKAYFLNMFVMKKEDFFNYCNYIFPILFELEKVLQSKQYEKAQERAVGFVGERLTGIYLKFLEKQRHTIKLPISFIEDTTEDIVCESENTIPIVLSANNKFIPYLSVFMESIKEHCSLENKYNIFVMTRDISSENKKIIQERYSGQNISIKFLNIDNKLQVFKEDSLLEHISLDTYSRFFIPEVLKNFDKCLYIDADTICLSDLSNLYNIDLESNYIAATRCAVINGMCNQNVLMKKYLQDIIGLDNYEDYFQAGVLVMNLKLMRENNFTSQLIELSKNVKVKYADQCLLNLFCKNKVKYIDMAWNYEYNHNDLKTSNFVDSMSCTIRKAYYKAMHNPKIIHFQGYRKPWSYPDEEYAKTWWYYARKSPYYEDILYNNILKHADEHIKNYKNKRFYKNIGDRIFSITNHDRGFKQHKVITICGLKFKIRYRKK